MLGPLWWTGKVSLEEAWGSPPTPSYLRTWVWRESVIHHCTPGAQCRLLLLRVPGSGTGKGSAGRFTSAQQWLLHSQALASRSRWDHTPHHPGLTARCWESRFSHLVAASTTQEAGRPASLGAVPRTDMASLLPAPWSRLSQASPDSGVLS